MTGAAALSLAERRAAASGAQSPAPLALGQFRSEIVTISALPATVNLELYTGDDFLMTLTVTDPGGLAADLSDQSAAAQIRATHPGPVAGAFTATVELNTVILHLRAAVSAELPTRGVWDCRLTSTAGWVTTLAAGVIVMTADVTRP